MSNVTMIDNLPQLEEVEGDKFIGEHLPPDMINKYGKTIRQKYNGYATFQTMNQAPSMQQPQPQNNEPPRENRSEAHFVHPFSFSCIDVSNHVKECPICCRFYHSDNTLYIILIVILSIICLLLLKRVLNV